MFELKPLSQPAIPAAIEKAMRYRLLNEPGEAERICLDGLHTDPQNQQALVILLLALTDRFGQGYAVSDAQVHEVLARLQNEYERAYYAGIIFERKAKAKLNHGGPGSSFTGVTPLSRSPGTVSWRAKAPCSSCRSPPTADKTPRPRIPLA